MLVVVRDVIDSLEKNNKGKVKKVLELDPCSYASLREELGISFDEELTTYHGYLIKVDPDGEASVRLI